MTIEELYEIIKEQQEEINQLKCDLNRLKERSDLNDFYLQEMIDALTESVDSLIDSHCCCKQYQEHYKKY